MKNRIKSGLLLLKNKDFKNYIFYILKHPKILFSKKETLDMPDFLTDKDYIDISTINQEKAIKKINCEENWISERKSFFDDEMITVHLAGIDDVLDINNIEWDKEYKDSEDVAALHRFLWLYREVWDKGICDNLHVNKCIKKIIYSWIDNVESKEKESLNPEVWQTYSTVERIVCWLIVLGMTEMEADKDNKIVSSIIKQMSHIQRNLEYYGENFTGNHFFNDGRGLYIGGSLLGIPEFVELGRKIIKNSLDKIIPDGGFLREGSTHYQFLITKWICDIFWIARLCGDRKFEMYLKPRLEGCLSGCVFFLVCASDKISMPFIGDISPDLTPSWLIGVVNVAEYLISGKYNRIFDKEGYQAILSKKCWNTTSEIVYDKCSLCGNNDWKKIISAGYRIFAHVNNSIYPNNLTGHFHHDSGSFVAYFQELPLFIDCGRVNYCQEGLGMWMKSCYSHNLLVIDNLNPEPDMRTFYNDSFIKDYFGAKPIIEKFEDSIVATIYGGKRCKGVEVYKRYIKVIDDKVFITDKIDGWGKHEGKMIFHISELWDVVEDNGGILIKNKKYRFRLDSDQCVFRIYKSGEKEFLYGNYSDEYGVQKKCVTVIANIQFKLPYKVTTILEKM